MNQRCRQEPPKKGLTESERDPSKAVDALTNVVAGNEGLTDAQNKELDKLTSNVVNTAISRCT